MFGAGPLEARLVQLEMQVRKLTAEHLRTIAEIERNQTFRRDGYRSTTVYVAHTLGVSLPEAGTALRRQPPALDGGRV